MHAGELLKNRARESMMLVAVKGRDGVNALIFSWRLWHRQRGTMEYRQEERLLHRLHLSDDGRYPDQF